MDDSSAWEDVYEFIERVRTMKEPDYLLDQTIIPGGLTVVGGEAKIGKSFIALDMMLALTTGKAIGTTWVPRPEPLCVLYIDLDGTIRGTATRAADFLTTRPAPALQQLGRWRHGSFRLMNREEFAQLYAIIEQRNVRVLFIDTLVKTYDGDENNSADMRAFLTLIDELRHDTGCAVVLVHHYRKRSDYQQQTPGPTPMDPQVLLRGSSALAGWYDQIVGCASGFVKLASGIEAAHVIMRQGKNEALMWTRYELLEGPHGRVNEILYGTWSKENTEWHQPKGRRV
jgi:hypothetical protein